MDLRNEFFERVTTLDRSTEPFPVQISEAFSLLQCSPDTLQCAFDRDEAVLLSEVGFGPSEEWVLRWLLKRISGGDGQWVKASTNVQTWLLLKFLIARLPITISARLLNEFGFGRVLIEGLQALCESKGSFQSKDANANGQADNADEMMDSVTEVKASKKRKRKSTKTAPITSVAFPIPNASLSNTFLAICGTIEQIMFKIETAIDGPHRFAGERLKLLFRYDLARAVKVLALSFRLTSMCLEADELPAGEDAVESYFQRLICPFIFVWDSRDLLTDVTMIEQVQSFCADSLIPALEVISINRRRKLGLDTTRLERLITTHCIVPSQETYFKLQSRDSRSAAALASCLNYVFEAFSQSEGAKTAPSSNSEWNRNYTVDCISIFFEIAIKSTYFYAPQSRNEQISWFKDLSQCLLGCVSFDPLGTSFEINLRSISVASELLYLAAENHITVERSILESLLPRLAKIPADLMPEYWHIVSLSIKIYPDIFVLVRPLEELGPIIQSLLGHLDIHLEWSVDNAGLYPQPYINSLLLFVIPLLNANVQARRLLEFLRFWRVQLEAHFRVETSEAISNRNGGHLLCVWKDSRLLAKVSAAVEGSLTIEQAEIIVEELLLPLSTDELSNQDTARSNTSLIVLQALLDGIQLDTYHDRLRPSVQKLHGLQSALIMANKTMPLFCGNLLRSENILGRRWPEIQMEHGVSKARLDLLGVSASMAVHGMENTTLEAEYYETAFHAFSLICHQMSLPVILGEARTFFSGLVERLYSILGSNVKALQHKSKDRHHSTDTNSERDEYEGMLESWNSTQILIRHWKRLVESCASLLFDQYSLLECLPPLHRRLFLERVRGHAFYEWYEGRKQDEDDVWNLKPPHPFRYSWLSLWKTLVGSSAARDLASTYRTIREINISALEELCTGSQDQKSDLYRRELTFTTFELQQQRFECWSRQERANIADFLLTLALRNDSYDPSVKYTFLCLIQRVLVYPSEEMVLLQEPITSLQRLGKIHDGDAGSKIASSAPILRKISEIVADYALSKADRSKAVLNIEQVVEDMAKPTKQAQLRPASWTWLTAYVQQLESHVKDGSLDVPYLSLELTKAMTNQLRKIRRLEEVVDPGILVILEGFFALKQHDEPTDDILSHCLRSLVNILLPSEDPVPSFDIFRDLSSDLARDVFNKLQTLLAKLSGRFRDGQNVLLRATTIKFYESPQAASAHICRIRDDYNALSYGEKACFLKEFASPEDWIPGPNELRLLQKIIKCHPTRISDLPTDSERAALKVELGSLFLRLLSLLERPEASAQWIGISTLLDGMLRNQSWAVSQFHIDSVISTVAIVAFKPGMKSEQKDVPGLYTWLCTLIASVLAVHRVRVSGRYHLLIEALQALLRLLFKPYPQDEIAPAAQNEPPERLQRPSAAVLGPKHAATFARLLTTLCDPSPSAIKRPKHREREELHDETKKARNLAGQYMQYVLMEFCHLSLHGELAPGVRAALNPGLYSIFDAMSPNVTQVVNSALDPSGRAIFKSIYDEYKLIGQEHI